MKQEQLFTPWFLEKKSNCDTVYTNRHGVFAKIYGYEDNEREPISRLIAAAPDMYEALKHSRGVISTLLVMVKMDDADKIICHEALLKINEALSKASPY